jgi:membrane protein
MVYDSQRALAFVRFITRRFLEDSCLSTAGSLAYTTLFALVPLSAAALGILSGFPAFAQWRDRITSFAFANFVPATGDVVQEYLTQFADNASKATAIGVLVLVFSALMLMLSVEDAFNRIWRVPKNRAAGARVLIYWTMLTLGPLLLIVALALSSYLLTLPLLDDADARSLIKAHLLAWVPLLIEWITLCAAYRLIPNRAVGLRDAAVSALVAALLLELAKRGFSDYVTSGTNYQQVYGALAIVPIFILWIYLCWILVLLGASLCAALAAFDYRPEVLRLAAGEEFRGLVRVLAHFAAAQREGAGLNSALLREREPFLTDDLVQRYLGDLHRAGMIQKNDLGQWMMARDLASVTLYDVYCASDYRLPRATTLPAGGIAELDHVAAALMSRAGDGLRSAMQVPLSEIFPTPERSKLDSAPQGANQENIMKESRP